MESAYFTHLSGRSLHRFEDPWSSDDWDGWGEFEPCWLPFWGLEGFEDWVNEVLFEPLKDVNAESVEWEEDELHKVVPELNDHLWDEEEDLNDWPEDAPDELPDDPVDFPEPVVDLKEEREEEPVDIPEDISNEPSEPDEEAWEDVQEPEEECFDLKEDLNEWLKEIIDWEPNVFVDEDVDLLEEIKEEVKDELKEEED